jgi:dTDP-4-amino-4,6-dideoxygalactose transaminase
MIPFTKPHISEKAIEAVNKVLHSGWITTGPVTKEFEKQITEYCGCKKSLCLNSATAGLELILRWYGVGPGDEVIVPAYTYCATANVVMHCGAQPVLADGKKDDFNIDPAQIRALITEKTKVIIPVDLFGYPCDYDEINALVREDAIKKMFRPSHPNQEKLGRILVLSDAAHSLGGIYKGKRCGSLTDITVFSFHAVKNLTTSEGGAIAMNLPEPFDHEAEYKKLNVSSLHGQSKDALAKTTEKGWKYDVHEAGYKMNMTDILAAIGSVMLEEYDEMLAKRKELFHAYNEALSDQELFELPVFETADKISSYHVYNLRLKGFTEDQRDRVMDDMIRQQIYANVHFIPLPLLSFYRNQQFDIRNFPVARDNYSREISLPLFFTMSREQLQTVTDALIHSVKTIRNA